MVKTDLVVLEVRPQVNLEDTFRKLTGSDCEGGLTWNRHSPLRGASFRTFFFLRPSRTSFWAASPSSRAGSTSTLFLVGRASLRSFFALVPVLFFVVLVPAITIRALAERKSGTLELLLTLPIGDWRIVANASSHASVAMVGVGLCGRTPYALLGLGAHRPGRVVRLGPGDQPSPRAAAAGRQLRCRSGCSAARVEEPDRRLHHPGLVLCFAFAFIDKFAALLPEQLGAVLQFLSVTWHFENVARGVLDTRDLLYYLSLTAVGLVATAHPLSAARQ